MKIYVSFFCLFLLSGSPIAFAQQNAETTAPTWDQQVKEMRWNFNNILGLQLPSTLMDSLNGKYFKKTFSLNYKPLDASYSIELQSLRRTLERDSAFGGSKYYLLLNDIDVANIKIVSSANGEFMALHIPAKDGAQFLHRPFGYEPEQQVDSVLIGWYERIQEKTLLRAQDYLKQLLKLLMVPD